MKHLFIQTEDGPDVHFESPDGIDSTLCRLEIGGDSEIGISAAEETDLRVTCPACIQIVKTCWEISGKELDK